ncbi:unnamed protein product [Knipowitschia caucasica]
MAVPSLSTVLTNANFTMYQNGMTDLLTHITSPVPEQQYERISPFCWTRDDVLEWISENMEGTNFDARSINLAWSLDGPSLCRMSQADIMRLFGPQLGHHLYQNLLKHKAKPEFQSLPESDMNENLCELLDNFLFGLNSEMRFPLLSTITLGQQNEGPSVKKEEFCDNDFDLRLGLEQLTTLSDTVYYSENSDSELSSSSNSCVFSGLRTPESTSGESDWESYPSNKQIKTEMKDEEYCQRRPRGRPPKGSRDHNRSFTTPKKSKHAPRGSHLWEFIRDILVHPEKNPGLLKWEDRREGVFKFLKSEAVAQMWGQRKKNSSMTYEKLSRAMRYYYKRNILERVDGRRLVYKFGRNASGWRLSEVSPVM